MSDRMLPYVWNNADTSESINDIFINRSTDIDQILLEHGAIYLKGFGVDTVEKFQNCIEALDIKPLSYLDGNSPRTKLSSVVYTSTEYPAEYRISLHNELSYSSSWPSRLYFCCITPAESGGATSIADSRGILARLSAATTKLLEEAGIMYVRNLHGGEGAAIGKSWQQTFETQAREEVEAFCAAGGIHWEWKKDGGLRLTQVRPATVLHPQTGERVWFNQMEQFHPSSNPPEIYEAIQALYEDDPMDMPQYGCLGDGRAAPDEMLAEIRAAMEAETVEYPWGKGDFMIVDNIRVAHGRAPFSGARKVLVSMSA